MTLFQDKYRIESARLPGWNYANDGSYFLTICTHNCECFLGEILNGNLVLSHYGEIVREELLRSFEMRHELKCVSCVIMPNHLHLIVNLNQLEPSKYKVPRISAMRPKSISSFVGGFKSSATSRINALRNSKGRQVWHPRFYDHLIRNNCEFELIYNYIAQNPAIWHKDRFNNKKDSNTDSSIYPDNLA